MEVVYFTSIFFYLGRFMFYSFYLYWFTYTGVRRVPLGDQELLSFPEQISPLQDFTRVRVVQSLVLCVVFRRSMFVPLSVSRQTIPIPSILAFSLCNQIVCPRPIAFIICKHVLVWFAVPFVAYARTIGYSWKLIGKRNIILYSSYGLNENKNE